MDFQLLLAGSLFLIIIVANFASIRFGYEIFGDPDAEAKLQNINADPAKFKIGFTIIIIEHICIVVLAAMLFLVFGPGNMLLAVIWTVCRSTEGLVQIYEKLNYWKLLAMAGQYANAGVADRVRLCSYAKRILERKNTVFTYAQVLFSVGTFVYSLHFLIYNETPVFISGFGLVASIIYGIGNALEITGSQSKKMSNVGGGMILLYELVLGGWFIYFSF
ncbi:DUF4386 domain-containing protein [Kaarinaea lacus]